MSMYICDMCGDLVDKDDLPTYTEDFGYDTGVGWRSCPQTFVSDCHCGGTYVEAERCKLCDEYFNPDDLEGGVCKSCLEDELTYENAIKVGEINKEKVEINSFYTFAFTEDEIEKILKKELDEANRLSPSVVDDDVKNYLNEDKSWFGDWLIEQRKNPTKE